MHTLVCTESPTKRKRHFCCCSQTRAHTHTHTHTHTRTHTHTHITHNKTHTNTLTSKRIHIMRKKSLTAQTQRAFTTSCESAACPLCSAAVPDFDSSSTELGNVALHWEGGQVAFQGFGKRLACLQLSNTSNFRGPPRAHRSSQRLRGSQNSGKK